MNENRMVCGPLWGALVGLARAAEGSIEVSEGTAQAVLMGLKACREQEALDEEALTAVVLMVQKEKHVLAPDCSTCAAPCGRTEDARLSDIFKAPEAICAAKKNLMESLIFAGAVCSPNNTEGLLTLLGGLFALGYDTDNEGWILDFAAKVLAVGNA